MKTEIIEFQDTKEIQVKTTFSTREFFESEDFRALLVDVIASNISKIVSPEISKQLNDYDTKRWIKDSVLEKVSGKVCDEKCKEILEQMDAKLIASLIAPQAAWLALNRVIEPKGAR